MYVHPIHFLPLLKWAAYVQSAPTIALLELQRQSPFHLVSWSLADMFAMLFAYFIYYSHAFCLCFLCVLCNKKKSFPDQCTNDSNMHSPNQFSNPQAMSSLLFLHQTMLCLNFCKASIFYNLWAYASIVDHNFFLRENSDWIIRINIWGMFWAWEILIMSSPGTLWITQLRCFWIAEPV